MIPVSTASPLDTGGKTSVGCEIGLYGLNKTKAGRREGALGVLDNFTGSQPGLEPQRKGAQKSVERRKLALKDTFRSASGM